MKTTEKSFLLSLAAAFTFGIVSTTPVNATENWPDKPITYVVPFSPGGSTDIVGRTYAQAIGADLGVPVVVENKPGMGGSLGAAYASRAKPDGYTLLGGSISSQAVNVSLYPNIGYDPLTSFMPVIMTASVPNVLLVRADSTIKSVDDLIAKAREKQDGVTYGSAGVGSSHHLAGALFADTIGSQMLHVPYKGSAPALQALVAGDIDILFDNLTSAVPLVESGRLRALAITSSSPSEALPNIKPLKDLGLKDYEVVSWRAVYVPAGTPQAIVDKLYTVLHAALQKPAVQDRLKGMGMTISGAGPEELATFQKTEIAKWAALIRKANIKVNN